MDEFEENDMKRILLTGGAGFIAHHTIRQLLQNTDWKVTMAKEKGTTLSSSFKTWRDNLRKIPQDYTTLTKYNELLARDSDGNTASSSGYAKPIYVPAA